MRDKVGFQLLGSNHKNKTHAQTMLPDQAALRSIVHAVTGHVARGLHRLRVQLIACTKVMQTAVFK